MWTYGFCHEFHIYYINATSTSSLRCSVISSSLNFEPKEHSARLLRPTDEHGHTQYQQLVSVLSPVCRSWIRWQRCLWSAPCGSAWSLYPPRAARCQACGVRLLSLSVLPLSLLCTPRPCPVSGRTHESLYHVPCSMWWKMTPSTSEPMLVHVWGMNTDNCSKKETSEACQMSHTENHHLHYFKNIGL